LEADATLSLTPAFGPVTLSLDTDVRALVLQEFIERHGLRWQDEKSR